jgi:hypothetical protein
MKRLPMRKIREALRLRADGFSGRRVAQSLSLGRATISEYFRRADVEGLTWPLPTDLSDADLEQRLFGSVAKFFLKEYFSSGPESPPQKYREGPTKSADIRIILDCRTLKWIDKEQNSSFLVHL